MVSSSNEDATLTVSGERRRRQNACLDRWTEKLSLPSLQIASEDLAR